MTELERARERLKSIKQGNLGPRAELGSTLPLGTSDPPISYTRSSIDDESTTGAVDGAGASVVSSPSQEQIIDEALETLMKEPTVTPTGGSRRRATQRRREGLVPPVAWVNPTAEMELELEESGDDGGTGARQVRIDMREFEAKNTGWADGTDWAVDVNYAKGSNAPAAASLGKLRRGKGAGRELKVQEMMRRAKLGEVGQRKTIKDGWNMTWGTKLDDMDVQSEQHQDELAKLEHLAIGDVAGLHSTKPDEIQVSDADIGGTSILGAETQDFEGQPPTVPGKSPSAPGNQAVPRRIEQALSFSEDFRSQIVPTGNPGGARGSSSEGERGGAGRWRSRTDQVDRGEDATPANGGGSESQYAKIIRLLREAQQRNAELDVSPRAAPEEGMESLGTESSQASIASQFFKRCAAHTARIIQERETGGHNGDAGDGTWNNFVRRLNGMESTQEIIARFQEQGVLPPPTQIVENLAPPDPFEVAFQGLEPLAPIVKRAPLADVLAESLGKPLVQSFLAEWAENVDKSANEDDSKGGPSTSPSELQTASASEARVKSNAEAQTVTLSVGVPVLPTMEERPHLSVVGAAREMQEPAKAASADADDSSVEEALCAQLAHERSQKPWLSQRPTPTPAETARRSAEAEACDMRVVYVTDTEMGLRMVWHGEGGEPDFEVIEVVALAEAGAPSSAVEAADPMARALDAWLQFEASSSDEEEIEEVDDDDDVRDEEGATKAEPTSSEGVMTGVGIGDPTSFKGNADGPSAVAGSSTARVSAPHKASAGIGPRFIGSTRGVSAISSDELVQPHDKSVKAGKTRALHAFFCRECGIGFGSKGGAEQHRKTKKHQARLELLASLSEDARRELLAASSAAGADTVKAQVSAQQTWPGARDIPLPDAHRGTSAGAVHNAGQFQVGDRVEVVAARSRYKGLCGRVEAVLGNGNRLRVRLDGKTDTCLLLASTLALAPSSGSLEPPAGGGNGPSTAMGAGGRTRGASDRSRWLEGSAWGIGARLFRGAGMPAFGSTWRGAFSRSVTQCAVGACSEQGDDALLSHERLAVPHQRDAGAVELDIDFGKGGSLAPAEFDGIAGRHGGSGASKNGVSLLGRAPGSDASVCIDGDNSPWTEELYGVAGTHMGARLRPSAAKRQRERLLAKHPSRVYLESLDWLDRRVALDLLAEHEEEMDADDRHRRAAYARRVRADADAARHPHERAARARLLEAESAVCRRDRQVAAASAAAAVRRLRRSPGLLGGGRAWGKVSPREASATAKLTSAQRAVVRQQTDEALAKILWRASIHEARAHRARQALLDTGVPAAKVLAWMPEPRTAAELQVELGQEGAAEAMMAQLLPFEDNDAPPSTGVAGGEAAPVGQASLQSARLTPGPLQSEGARLSQRARQATPSVLTARRVGGGDAESLSEAPAPHSGAGGSVRWLYLAGGKVGTDERPVNSTLRIDLRAALRGEDPRWELAGELGRGERVLAGAAALTVGGEPRVYVVGGRSLAAPQATVDWHRAGGPRDWVPAKNMTHARRGPGVAEVGGKLYVAGGQDDAGATGVVEVYDPAADYWTTLTPMRAARTNFPLVAHGGALYAVGGWDGFQVLDRVERLDLGTGAWHECAPLQSPRCLLGAVVWGGRLYAVGGFAGLPLDQDGEVLVEDGTRDGWLASLESLDLVGGAEAGWRAETAALAQARADHATLLVPPGLVGDGAGARLLVLGGYDGVARLSSAESLVLPDGPGHARSTQGFCFDETLRLPAPARNFAATLA